jgi:hypothetical protein
LPKSIFRDKRYSEKQVQQARNLLARPSRPSKKPTLVTFLPLSRPLSTTSAGSLLFRHSNKSFGLRLEYLQLPASCEENLGLKILNVWYEQVCSGQTHLPMRAVQENITSTFSLDESTS